MKIVLFIFTFFTIMSIISFSILLLSIRTNSNFVLKTMEDLDQLMFELEKKKKLVVVRIYNETKP